jgi:23S rRNA (adenine2030-N6)-methyltransferase
MLSYQHGYHAGNFADVHKHTALCLLLRHFANEPKLVTYVDSHAGRGQYDLSGEQAQKVGEWKDGIAQFSKDKVSADALKLYLNTISDFQEKHTSETYPGSPALMHQMMQPNDRAVLFELHPAEYIALRKALEFDKRLRILDKNAMNFLIDYLPDRKSPGALLIDPSYEMKDEYQTIARLAKIAQKRWQQGVVMVWYPMLPAKRHEELKAGLKGAEFFELIGPEKERGMYGTGLAIFNFPEKLKETFLEAQGEMQRTLFGS